MNQLNVQFFGENSIRYCGRRVYLPYAKAEEVFFVLLHERNIGRVRLCDLVWDLEECDEDKAKRNLRHVIYTIRKHTDETLIQSPKRETILIGDGCVIDTDLDILLAYDPAVGDAADTQLFLECYRGPFMQFCRTASGKLENWIEETAQEYHRVYLGKLRQTIERLILEERYDLAEACCQRLLALEEYDEQCCIALMQLYQKTGQYAKAMEVYQSLEARLEADLWVRPLPETTQAYLSVKRSAIEQKKQNTRQPLYGRNEELRLLRHHVEAFMGRNPFRHCVISGEAGIGKTALMQAFLKEVPADCLALDLCCYELEESFLLRFWDRVLEMVANFISKQVDPFPEALARSIGRVFPTFHIWCGQEGEYGWKRTKRVSGIDQNICQLFRILRDQYGIQTLMAVDDLQWIDNDSLALLSKVLFAGSGAVMLVGACRDEQREKLRRFQYHVGQFSEMEIISLTRFSQAHTWQFIRQNYPEMLDRAGDIYTYSEGNPLFLTEVIRNLQDDIHISRITGKMAHLVEGRILQLSENARKLMSICAMFYDNVSVQLLAELVEFGENLLMDAIEELVQKGILREHVRADGAIRLTFSHSMIRKYVYDAMPQAKRIIMHGRIGTYLEAQLRGIRLDRIAYPELIYHYEKAENKVKLFEYKLKQMQLTFNVCHELFPVLETEQEEGLFDEYGNVELVGQEFQRLWEIYDEISAAHKPCIRELQILFLYLYGRFSNGSGNLPVANKVLNQLMELTGEHPQDIQYQYRGAIQLIQYAINSNNLDLMRENVELALSLAEQTGDVSQAGLAYRHWGYYHILRGEYDQGEVLFGRARACFESLDNPKKYRLHIAATYFFAGEGKCRQERLQEALELYTRTLELCDVEANLTSTAVLYLRFGYIYYRLGDYDRAKGFLIQSIKAYERIIFIWGRADAYTYLYKVCERENEPARAKKYREMAEQILAEHAFHPSI